MQAEEAVNFRLIGHDASAAWGGVSLVFQLGRSMSMATAPRVVPAQ